MASHIDVHDTHEYPIILGNTLKDTARVRSKYVQLRYNWEPPDGYHGHNGNLRQTNDGMTLSYQREDSSAPLSTYDGFHSPIPKDNDRVESSRLVLVLNESKSAFVLERISTSIDLNITSATALTKEEIDTQRQLRPLSADYSSSAETKRSGDGGDGADLSNPFDFRHFLAEARESIEKPTLQTGNKTPLLGSSTPVGQVSSPSLNTGRFASTAPVIPNRPSTSTRKAFAANPPVSKAKTVRKGPTKRKESLLTKAAPPLSKERISDSDDELSDAASVEPAPNKGHTRNVLSTDSTSRSDNIVLMEGGLEIDGGSPLQEPRRRYKIDAEAFRSQTHTPVMQTASSRRAPPRTHHEDIVMKDPDQSDREEEDEEDGDVESIELDPQHSKKYDHDHLQPVDTPPAIAQMDDDDDDDNDALVAELMEALGKEEPTAGDTGMNGYGHVDDEESEISEEE